MNNKIFLSILRFFSKGWDVSFLVLLPFIQKIFQLTLLDIGFLSMVYVAASIVFSFFAGVINERIGNGKVLVLVVILYMAAWGGFLVAHSTPELWILFILGGIGSGLVDPITNAMIAREAETSGRAKALGDFAAVGDLGRIAFTTATALLIGYLSLSFTAAFYSGIALLMLIYLLFHASKQNVRVEQERVNPGVGFTQLLKAKEYLLAIGVAILDSFSSTSLFIFLPFLLIPKGIDIKETGIFTAIFFVGYFAGRMLLGRVGDKYGKPRILILSEIIMAILIVSLIYIQIEWMVMINLFVLGVFTRGSSPLIKAMIADAIHKDHFEKGYSLYLSSVRAANAASRPAYSFIGNLLGISSIFYLSGFVALLTIIPAVFFYKSLKTRAQHS